MRGALAPAALGGLDKATQESAVTQYLTTARERLSLALEATGPHAVASLRAEIATAAEATKQLGLSKEIQLDAQEMVRRAEYALGKAIRKGQAEDTVRSRGDRGSHFDRWSGELREPQNSKASPYDYADHSTLYGDGKSGGNGILAMADNATEEQFEEALSEAKAEQNVSRANVVRKIKAEPSKRSATQQLDEIADLADHGHTSDQIARKLGVGEDWVRRVAKQAGIEIPADKVMRGTRRLDHTKFVNETVMALEALASGMDVLDLSKVDESQIHDWSTSLTDSLRVLNRLARQIKEMDQ